jgi:hypothetical protein
VVGKQVVDHGGEHGVIFQNENAFRHISFFYRCSD